MSGEELDPISVNPVKDEDLDDWWKNKAYNELQEKREWRSRDIQALRELVMGAENLTSPLDDDFLLRFLRVQKFDYDKAFLMVQRYFLMKKTWPENFAKAIPSLAKLIYKHQQQTIVPYRDKDGRRIFLFRAGIWDPNRVSPSDISAANYMMMEMIAREAKTQISGLVVVVDMNGFSFRHVMHITTDYVKSIANMIQNSFPLRFREIHIINESSIFHIVFALIKPFLSETIKNRIKFHGYNLQSLHQSVNPAILPEEFGGTLGPMSNDEVVGTIMECEDLFKEMKNFGFNQNLSANDIEDMTEVHPFQGYCLASEENL